VTPSAEPKQLIFQNFIVLENARQVVVEGETVKLGARAFDVLLALIERRDRVVSRNELFDLVWPGQVVEDNNLTVQISALRKILGPDIIVNVAGRGYRLTATPSEPIQKPDTVAVLPAASPSEPISALTKHDSPPNVSATVVRPGPRRIALRWRVGIGLAGAVAAGISGLLISPSWHFSSTPQTSSPAAIAAPERSIAVLPFVDMSEKKDQEYFVDGMTEEIIDLLAKAPDLHVTARTSSFYFKSKPSTLVNTAHELNVAQILAGSIRRSGNRIRVTAKLVRADSGYQVWSQTYDRDVRDLFKVQDEIANAVVQALQITLLGGPLTRQRGGTQNLDAYQDYLRARRLSDENSKASLEAALEFLDKATALDPDFGLAWAWKAGVTMQMADSSQVPSGPGYEHARQLALRALQTSADLSDAHHVLQYIYLVYDWNWAASETEGKLALALNPANTQARMFLAEAAYIVGRWEDAVRQLRVAIDADPFYAYPHWQLATAMYSAGRYQEAEASYRKVTELAPNFIWGRIYLGKALLAQGKAEAALAVIQQEPDEETRLGFLPIALLANQRSAEADEALKTLATRFGNSSAYFVALNYAYKGDREKAMVWLDRAYQQRDSGLVEMFREPLLKNLVRDPKFKAFLEKMKLPAWA